MKIFHLINRIDNYATGPTNSILGLCDAQISLGASVKLLANDWGGGKLDVEFIERFKLSSKPRKLGISKEMRAWLSAQAETNHQLILHSHNIWTMQECYAFMVRKKYPKTRFMLSPHGTLSKYSLSTGSKLKPFYWSLLQKSILKGADCIHATSEGEYEDIRRLGIKVPVAVIPNGINLPFKIDKPNKDTHTFTYLGRIHPEKGLEMLLEAWGIVSRQLGNWRLKIAGPDPVDYKKYLQSIILNRSLKNVDFEPTVFGDSKQRLFNETEVLVLPSPSENFGMVVAEALSSGVPVITTSGTPWSELKIKKSGWYCDISAKSLAESMLSAALTDMSKRREMGLAGRDWMLESFNLLNIAEKMNSTYMWMLNADSTPPCVILD